MKADQERVSKLLTDTVTLLCKNGLIYKDEIKIQGLLGITLDKNDVFIVHINETIGSGGDPKESTSSEGTGKKGPLPGVPIVDLTRVADTPVISPSMRGMGPIVPGMSQPIPGGSGGGGLSARKQRPLMQQMMPRGQFMQMQRFRMGMSPANMHAMASSMNNHMMYSRQPGNLAGMPQMRQRLSGTPLLPTPSRRQQMQHTATVSIDDDEDVVIIGTGHEEPSPNWNSPVRRIHHGRSGSQQLNSTSQTKSSSSISLSGSVPASSVSNTDVDQLDISLIEGAAAEPDIAEISLSELSADACGKQKPSTNEVAARDQTAPVSVAPVAAAMLIEPNDEGSDVDNVHLGGDSTINGKSASEKPLNETVAANDSNAGDNNKSSEMEVDTKVSTAVPNEAVFSSAEEPDKADKDGTGAMLQNSSKIMLTEGQQPDTGQRSSLPVVYTDIAEYPEPLQFDGVQDTDMDIQTLGFDILTEDDHDVGHSSQLTSWNCKVSGCDASFGDANSLATHYTAHHTTQIDLLPNLCSAPQATDSSASEGSERGSTDGTRRRNPNKVMQCPFAGCPNKFSSLPGLYLHHKKVHGTQISKAERKIILATYGKPFKCIFSPACQKSYMTKRELSQHVVKAHDIPESIDSSTDIPSECFDSNVSTVFASELKSRIQSESVTGVTKNFLCLVSNCEVVCSSREGLVEHLQACHSAADASVKLALPEIKEESKKLASPEIKEENVEDQ